jgi:hypothetical protein
VSDDSDFDPSFNLEKEKSDSWSEEDSDAEGRKKGGGTNVTVNRYMNPSVNNNDSGSDVPGEVEEVGEEEKNDNVVEDQDAEEIMVTVVPTMEGIATDEVSDDEDEPAGTSTHLPRTLLGGEGLAVLIAGG